MKDINYRFKLMQEKYPNVSDYVNFYRAIKNQGFSEKAISLSFSKLVDKDDYDKKDRKQLIKQLALASKPSTTEVSGQNFVQIKQKVSSSSLSSLKV